MPITTGRSAQQKTLSFFIVFQKMQCPSRARLCHIEKTLILESDLVLARGLEKQKKDGPNLTQIGPVQHNSQIFKVLMKVLIFCASLFTFLSKAYNLVLIAHRHTPSHVITLSPSS